MWIKQARSGSSYETSFSLSLALHAYFWLLQTSQNLKLRWHSFLSRAVYAPYPSTSGNGRKRMVTDMKDYPHTVRCALCFFGLEATLTLAFIAGWLG